MERDTNNNHSQSLTDSIPLPEEKGGYIEQRMQGQMAYYHKKSMHLQKEYNWLSILNIVVTAMIPIFTLAMDSWDYCKYVIAVMGAISTVIASILLLHKTEERYSNYRKIYEALKTEKIYYLNRVEKYMNKEARECGALFIEKCEELMASEHNAWFNLKQDKS